jgi:hypothetical protein
LKEAPLNIHAILVQLDSEIAKLEQAKALLTTDKTPAKAASGRPKKRQMSPEGRARIAAAQKKRWAAAKPQQQ